LRKNRQFSMKRSNCISSRIEMKEEPVLPN